MAELRARRVMTFVHPADVGSTLHARKFPVERLVRDLEIAAELVEAALGEAGGPVAARLTVAAGVVAELDLTEGRAEVAPG